MKKSAKLSIILILVMYCSSNAGTLSAQPEGLDMIFGRVKVTVSQQGNTAENLVIDELTRDPYKTTEEAMTAANAMVEEFKKEALAEAKMIWPDFSEDKLDVTVEVTTFSPPAPPASPDDPIQPDTNEIPVTPDSQVSPDPSGTLTPQARPNSN